ncbi:myo-inositol-1(or 4)-monophosphatase [Rhodoblastus acidophilus]|uniref:inositol monophosphatase family protein n=1 Tax=Rhodoblastus acidophilus TaxID=1074 RepID=UPI002224E2A6|nr:inositol monophosphatase family protein [Rhodoblastus acidophilus]MCW2316597.1 myo-inositol-1(or 4)-monophosphatase [Rhodoblastus acidophilus]
MNPIEIAAEAARAAGFLLQPGRAHVASQLGRDIKLAEDAACEAAIRAALSARSSHPILGEETGWGETSPTDGPHWVIDPLDGSFNFSRGIPLFAVSIALCEGPPAAPRARLGVIYDPSRDEMIAGGEDAPLTLNGAPCSGLVAARRQILATGYPSKSDPDAVTARLGAATRDYTKIRMIGSAALSLAWLALGRLDGYEEQNIMWWDVAAGLALARAAGARRIDCAPRDGYAMDVAVAA